MVQISGNVSTQMRSLSLSLFCCYHLYQSIYHFRMLFVHVTIINAKAPFIETYSYLYAKSEFCFSFYSQNMAFIYVCRQYLNICCLFTWFWMRLSLVSISLVLSRLWFWWANTPYICRINVEGKLHGIAKARTMINMRRI